MYFNIKSPHDMQVCVYGNVSDQKIAAIETGK